MADKSITKSKFPAVITYIIVVLSLLVGLTLPLDTDAISGGGINFANMPLLQFTGALAALGIIGSLPFGTALSPAYSIETAIWGMNVNIGAILLLAYVIVTALALVLLIPVCAAKKYSPHARRMATVSEVIVIIVLAALTALQLLMGNGNFDLNVIIPLGVTVLMLIVQCIIYSKKRTAKKSADVGEYTMPQYAEAPAATETATTATAAEAVALPVGETDTAATPVEIIATPAKESDNSACTDANDKFIQKLDDGQKQEFLKLFVEKTEGGISGIPDYVIGGDNSKFFSYVFIFLARVRDLVSDGLMNKLYEEVNFM